MDFQLTELLGKSIGMTSIFFDRGPIMERLAEKLKKTVFIISSKETCCPKLTGEWSEENPVCGHSDVIALLANDCFGGEIFHDINHDYYFTRIANDNFFQSVRALKCGSLITAHETVTPEELVWKNNGDIGTRYSIFKKKAIEYLNRK